MKCGEDGLLAEQQLGEQMIVYVSRRTGMPDERVSYKAWSKSTVDRSERVREGEKNRETLE